MANVDAEVHSCRITSEATEGNAEHYQSQIHVLDVNYLQTPYPLPPLPHHNILLLRVIFRYVSCQFGMTTIHVGMMFTV